MKLLETYSPVIAGLFRAALRQGGPINAMQPASRRLLKDAAKRNTTPADLERMRAAQAKRERRAERNRRNAKCG
jgi:hypothetical protein